MKIKWYGRCIALELMPFGSLFHISAWICGWKEQLPKPRESQRQGGLRGVMKCLSCLRSFQPLISHQDLMVVEPLREGKTREPADAVCTDLAPGTQTRVEKTADWIRRDIWKASSTVSKILRGEYWWSYMKDRYTDSTWLPWEMARCGCIKTGFLHVSISDNRVAIALFQQWVKSPLTLRLSLPTSFRFPLYGFGFQLILLLIKGIHYQPEVA